MKPFRCIHTSLQATAWLVTMALSASAAGVWDGGDVSDNWSAPLNWDNDAAPASGTALVFDGSGVTATNDLTSFNAAGVTFNSGAGAFTLAGNNITLGGNLTSNSTTTQTFDIGLAFNATRTVSTVGDLVFNGPVTGGSVVLYKTGAGKLTISGTGGLAQLCVGNGAAGGSMELSGGAWTQTGTLSALGLVAGSAATGSGNLTISAGTHTFGGDGFSNAVRVGTATGTGQTATGSLTVTGGTLKIGTTGALDASLNLGTSMNTGTSQGTLVISGGTVEVGRRVLVGANQTVNTASLTLSGTGVLNMVRTGSNSESDLGYVRLGSGASTLNFNGGTYISTGLHTSSSSATSTINFNGTELRANAAAVFGNGGSPVMRVQSGGMIVNTNGFDATVGNPLLNSLTTTGALTKNGAGTLSLLAANTFSGAIQVNAGTLALTTGTLPVTSAFQVAGPGTMRLDSSLTRTVGAVTLADGAAWTGLTGVAVGGGRATVGGTLAFSGATAKIGVSALSAVPVAGNVYDVIQAGSITGSPALTVDFPSMRATGTAAVAGNKVQVTLTTLDAASLVWNNAAGTGVWNLNTSANFLNGVSNDVFKNADAVRFDDSVSPGVAKVVTVSGVLYPGNVTVDNSNGAYTINGETLAGAASLTKTGTGTLTLSGANTYTGGTFVNGGALAVGYSGAISEGALTLSNTGTVVRFLANNAFGQASVVPVAVVTANAGTTLTNTGVFTNFGPLHLNGATLTANGGANGSYHAYKLAGGVKATGASVIDVAAVPANANTQVHLGGNTQNALTTFEVTAATDTLTVSAVLRNGVTGQSGTLVQAGITKTGLGKMTISTASTYTGETRVDAGTLSLGTASLANAADVRMTSSAVLDLTHGSTDVIDEFYVDGVAKFKGTWGSLTSSAQYKTSLITGSGILDVTNGPTGTPYGIWAEATIANAVDRAENLDPDGDGMNNLGEFAFNGNPVSATPGGKVVTKIATIGGDEVLTLTLPVRITAVFPDDPAADLSASGDGVTYHIQATTDLSDLLSIEVAEVIPALADGLPALDTGWTYRTFRTVPTVAENPKMFLRAKVVTAP